MIRAFTFSVSLALALLALALPSASAVTFAECQAFLCLPGGFPPPECSAAHTAVLRRLAQLKPALPSWSSCAAAFGWDSANLSHNEHQHADCPLGGHLSGNTCRDTDSQGCTYSGAARQRVRVQVVVDGSTSFQPNHTLTHTQRPATPLVLDPGQNPLFCGQPPPPPPPQPPCQAVAGPGNPPPWYLLAVTCACPPGYPFPWPHRNPARKYCLSNPGRP